MLLVGFGAEVGAVECILFSFTAALKVGPMVLATGEGLSVAGAGPKGSGFSV